MATKEQHAALGHATLRIDEINQKFIREKNRAERPGSWVFFPLKDVEYLLACAEALQYYAHPDHYEPMETLGGTRQPGVLTEGGRRALTVVSEGKV